MSRKYGGTQPPQQTQSKAVVSATPPADTTGQEGEQQLNQNEQLNEDQQLQDGAGEQGSGTGSETPENKDGVVGEDTAEQNTGSDEREEDLREDDTGEPEGAGEQLDEVQAPHVPEPVEPPPPLVVPDSIVHVAETKPTEYLNVNEQQLVEFFKDYSHKMAKSRPVSATDIATNQVAWFRKVMIMLDLEPKTFRRVMDALLADILENIDGAYHPARRMRGMTAPLRLTENERVQFQVLMQLFCDMADPAGREAMRSQTSSEKALGNGLTETARGRLGDYFRLG